MPRPRSYLRLLVAAALVTCNACAPKRPAVPPGVVPEQQPVLSADEQYGHEVLAELMDRYKLETDDTRIDRVQKLVDRLTSAAKANSNPWHVYVLVDDNFKNAAATRGNFVFVWTGILNSVNDDDELATVLAHEIGHALAGHTQANPSEEVNDMISQVGGSIAGTIVGNYTGIPGVADLTDILISQSMKAILVNPEAQRKEYEADQIGLFLMADAGYDPEKAIEFWTRVAGDPSFRDFPIQFMSSHPSSAARVENLRKLLPEAVERFRVSQVGASPTDLARGKKRLPKNTQQWRVEEAEALVFERPEARQSISRLRRGTVVSARSLVGRWLEITDPVTGYVRSRDLAPLQ